MKIAFQGVPGANSYVGIRNYFPHATPIGYADSEEVFESLLNGQTDLAFLPVENSIMGNVDLNVDLIYQHPVTVIGEYYVPIDHCLLALPGTSLAQLTTVYSHPVALAQCRPFIHSLGLKALPDFDTAGAARALAERQNQKEAAIAPALCAQLYGLEIVATQIQQVQRNITRFVALVPNSSPESISVSPMANKTSLALITAHEPGALARCLAEFAHFGINLTRLESRPIPEDPFAYIFYIDLLAAADAPAVGACLAKITPYLRSLKVLGSYPQAAPFCLTPRQRA